MGMKPIHTKEQEMKKKQEKVAEKTTEKLAAKKPGRKPGRKPSRKPAATKKAAKPALTSVTFTVHAEAGQDVRLAGTFTDWEAKAKKMTFKKSAGVYSASVKLAPGEYQYKFIIGGKWATDDQNTEFVPNDKGTFNSKLVVK